MKGSLPRTWVAILRVALLIMVIPISGGFIAAICEKDKNDKCDKSCW